MTCPKCGSNNVNVQIVNEQTLVKKKKGFWHFIFLWWWDLCVFIFKWLFFFVPALICKLFKIGGNKEQIKNKQKSVCVCQNCGYHWNA